MRIPYLFLIRYAFIEHKAIHGIVVAPIVYPKENVSMAEIVTAKCHLHLKLTSGSNIDFMYRKTEREW